MKKLAFFVSMIVTYYVAGMYQYFPLMVMFVMELLVFLVMFFLPQYFKRHLTVELLKKNDYVEKDEDLWCKLKITNTGKLPVSRIKLKVRLGYQQDPKKGTRSMYGGSECGDNELQFGLCAQYCGMIQLQMISLSAYDYLALFHAGKHLEKEMMVAVFPVKKALHIESDSFEFAESYQAQGQRICHKGDDHNEIRQIREYREGDSSRYIHWNQSARTDLLWIKEYEKEGDDLAEILLDPAGFEKADPADMDAFYELLSALALGLLEKVSRVRVYWYDSRYKCLVSREAVNDVQCRDMLLALYRTEYKEAELSSARDELKKCMAQGSRFFRLGLDLSWHLGGMRIYQFSKENLEQEITQKVFML